MVVRFGIVAISILQIICSIFSLCSAIQLQKWLNTTHTPSLWSYRTALRPASYKLYPVDCLYPKQNSMKKSWLIEVELTNSSREYILREESPAEHHWKEVVNCTTRENAIACRRNQFSLFYFVSRVPCRGDYCAVRKKMTPPDPPPISIPIPIPVPDPVINKTPQLENETLVPTKMADLITLAVLVSFAIFMYCQYRQVLSRKTTSEVDDSTPFKEVAPEQTQSTGNSSVTSKEAPSADNWTAKKEEAPPAGNSTAKKEEAPPADNSTAKKITLDEAQSADNSTEEKAAPEGAQLVDNSTGDETIHEHLQSTSSSESNYEMIQKEDPRREHEES